MNDTTHEKILILLRGLPSSGKSYRAKELTGGNESIIFSADKFWGQTREEYIANWCREKLGMAHNWCRQGVSNAMLEGFPLVVVDNTNTTVKEMMAYYQMAMSHGYSVRIEEPTSSWWINDIAPYLMDKVTHKDRLEAAAQVLCEKNRETHGVPIETMRAMLERYQPNVTVADLSANFSVPPM